MKLVSNRSVRTHRPRLGVLDPFRRAAAGLIDAQHGRRLRLGQQRVGVHGVMPVRHRPAHPELGGDRGHAPAGGDLPRSCRHSRPVSRARAGISAIDSVNALRGQACSRHRYCRLRHRTASGSSPYGRSRGRVVRRCFTDVETTPHCGQPAALDAVVTTCTNGPGSARQWEAGLRARLP